MNGSVDMDSNEGDDKKEIQKLEVNFQNFFTYNEEKW